jgi:hypothetical protein
LCSPRISLDHGLTHLVWVRAARGDASALAARQNSDSYYVLDALRSGRAAQRVHHISSWSVFGTTRPIWPSIAADRSPVRAVIIGAVDQEPRTPEARISARVIFWGAASPGPVDFGRPLHRRGLRVLDLDPMAAEAATIWSISAKHSGQFAANPTGGTK